MKILVAVVLIWAVNNEAHLNSLSEEWVEVYVGNGVYEWVDLKASVADPVITEDNVTFYLSNRLLNGPEVLKVGDVGTIESFQKDWKTAFAIHGYSSGHSSMQMIVDAYLEGGEDYNIINVDWSGPANLAYESAVKSLEGVGTIVARLIDFLVENGLDMDKLNIVGWSLGAHVAGVAGKKTIGIVARVTGLDPAGPLIEIFAPQSLLNTGDAASVEVIHTDMGLAGYVGDLGHADFYPNSGSYQAGCGNDTASHSCSHSRAPRYFAESVTSTVGFVATKCTSWDDYVNDLCSNNPTVLMGAFTPMNATGDYYLRTNSEPPFTMG